MPDEPAPLRRSLQSVGVVLAGWFVFFVLWSLFILGWVNGNLSMAVRAGAEATGLSAIGGLVVWRLTGRQPWPAGPIRGFVARHAGYALLFTIAWTTLGPILFTALRGESLLAIEWDVPVTSWRLLMGFWLYVILAGLSYAVRSQRRLREEEARLARARQAAAEARLASLRAQLQPHFLFNALHSVMALVRIDADEAEAALERLGDLLRYAVRERESELVSMGEERRFTEDYLELQRMRFGDSLRVDWEVAESLDGISVPAFVLQPLVENAVRHGVEGSGGAGHIRIVMRREEGRVVIRVCDDGPGFQPSTDGEGTGLKTLRERLAGLYGNRAQVLPERTKTGTCVTVTLPDSAS